MTIGKVPVVFKTKELSNALDRQLKNFTNKLYQQTLLQIQVHLILHDNLMTHFLGKVPVVFKTKELSNALDRQLKNLMTN